MHTNDFAHAVISRSWTRLEAATKQRAEHPSRTERASRRRSAVAAETAAGTVIVAVAASGSTVSRRIVDVGAAQSAVGALDKIVRRFIPPVILAARGLLWLL